MRNWIASEIEATIPVLELLCSQSMPELAKSVTRQETFLCMKPCFHITWTPRSQDLLGLSWPGQRQENNYKQQTINQLTKPEKCQMELISLCSARSTRLDHHFIKLLIFVLLQ